MMKDGNVSYVESKRVKIERWLAQKGFFLGSPTSGARNLDGSRWEGDLDDGFGLIMQKSPRKSFWGFTIKPADEKFIASIWLQDPSDPLSRKKVGASSNSWVIEVYGREHFDSLIRLSKEMSGIFNVKIHVRLEREHPRSANYYMDD